MVLEIIGGVRFLPPPGQWSDPKSPGTIGLRIRYDAMVLWSLGFVMVQGLKTKQNEKADLVY